MIPELPADLGLSLDQLDRDGAFVKRPRGYPAGGFCRRRRRRRRVRSRRVACSSCGAQG